MLQENIIRPAQGRHPYLSGNFAPIARTRSLTPCSSEGKIPEDLAGGQYVRNGANPLANDDLGRAAHWFDGDGMLTGVLFRRVRAEKGSRDEIRPEFVNQYIVTDVFAYAWKSRAGLTRPILPSIATLLDPCASVLLVVWTVIRTLIVVLLSRLPGRRPLERISVANTNVVYHDGRALATCESGPPLRVALPTLETIGWFDGRVADGEGITDPRPALGGRGPLAFMKEWTTAHPKVDLITGEMLAFHSVFVKPYVYYSVVGTPSSSSKRAGRDESLFGLPVPGMAGPKMMHDFGVSRRFTVIMDLPLELDPSNLVKGKPALNYDPHGRSRFGVFPRHNPDAVRWFETSACCIFHTANCWDTSDGEPAGDGGSDGAFTSVHLLACRMTSPSMVFTAGNLPPPPSRPAQPIPPAYADGRLVEEEQCRLYYLAFPLSPHRRPAPAPPPAIAHQFALSAIPFEFPAVSPAHAMGAARYVYGCSSSTQDTFSAALGKAAKVDVLAKLDVQTLIARGRACRPPLDPGACVDRRDVAAVLASADPADPIKLFRLPRGHYAQEPRFVPRRDATSEDDGWLLTYVFDESQLGDDGECPNDKDGEDGGNIARSELWIVDARGMRDVVAKIALPQRVPYGLHGTWFSEREIAEQRPFARLRSVEDFRGQGRSGQAWEAVRSTVESWLG